MTVSLNISQGNTKLGRIPSVSLTPIVSCEPGVKCSKICYAQRVYRRYYNVRVAWDGNLHLWRKKPEKFVEDLWSYLEKSDPLRFRWHVGGDIPDGEYLAMMMETAANFPDTRFLVYTKRESILMEHLGIDEEIPSNLALVYSRILGDSMRNPWNLPESHVLFPKLEQKYLENRENAFVCAGTCRDCGYCWEMRKGDAVIFPLH